MKRCCLAVKALSRAPNPPPAQCPHLMRVLFEGRGRGMEASAKGVAGRIWQWAGSYVTLSDQVVAGAQPKNSLESFIHQV